MLQGLPPAVNFLINEISYHAGLEEVRHNYLPRPKYSTR